MADKKSNALPKLNFEQRRAAAGQYERAQQVIGSNNFDYGIQLLRNCCKLDPANFTFRQALRQAQKDKYGDDKRGQRLAFLTGLSAKVKLQASLTSGKYLQALEYGEDLLTRNPWDVRTLLGMGEAFEELGLLEHALWSLDQARQIKPDYIRVNRRLAQVLEKRGNFVQAMKFWELVRNADPSDQEAQHKAKDLAASDTIARGKYQDAIDGQVKSPAGFNMDPDQAVEEGEESADKPPAKPSTGHIPSAEERGNKEISTILEKIQNHPKVANNYLHLAGIYRRHEKFDKARQILEQGLGATGNNFEIGLEILDLEIEPFRRNLEITTNKLQRKPDDPELQKLRARLFKEINTRELDYFRQKAERYSTETIHRFEMGVRLFHVGQVDEAIKELQAVRNDPRHRAHALYYLGFCFTQRNNWKLAQRNFEEALQHLAAGEDDLRKEILFQLAVGSAKSGDLARAVDLGCELANLDYGYKDIGKLLEDWQNRLQKA
jgi:tetratricopeptide (TPR) repeat protein